MSERNDSGATGSAKVPVVAVDGPSGVGKGTVCARLADYTGFHLLDSGALYRLVALASERTGIDSNDAAALAQVAQALPVSFETGAGDEPVIVRLNGEDVGKAIRSESCGSRASQVAAHPAVRDALLDLQHGFRRAPGLIADGRDMGTVVFPDAGLKIFLDASAQVRAERRHKQLMGKGIGVSLAALFDEIAERDKRDRNRAVAPLRAAPDAVQIDTSALSIDAVMEAVLAALRDAGITGTKGSA